MVKHVTSLPLSKQVTKYWKGGSEFWWIDKNLYIKVTTSSGEYVYVPVDSQKLERARNFMDKNVYALEEHYIDNKYILQNSCEIYPALLATEILEKLPAPVGIFKIENDYRTWSRPFETPLFKAPTPQDALCRLFIYLKKEKLI